MKKLVLAAMMMGMIAVTPVMAHAAEAEQTTESVQMTETQAPVGQILNWDDNMTKEFTDKGLSGQFFTIDELDLKLMIPEGMAQRERTEDEAKNNIATVFADEKNEKTVKIRFDEIAGCTSLEDVAKMLVINPENKVEIGFAKINGLGAVLVKNAEANTVSAVFPANEGRFLQVICSPVSDPAMFELFQYVIASVQTIS